VTRRLYLRLYLTLLAVTTVCLVAVGIAFRLLGGDPIGPPAERLRVAAGVVNDALREAHGPELSSRLEALGDELSMDLVVWDAGGHVLAEANRHPAVPMFPAAPRPGTPGAALGRAWVPDRGGLELVAPLGTDGHQIGLRNRHRGRVRRPFSFPVGLGILAVVMAVASYPVARRLAKRLEQVASGVERWGKGDLGHRVPVEGEDEVATLAATFNRAASQIDELVAQQRQMLANASHELRSPLARLRMALELLSEEPSAGDRARLIEESRLDIVDLDVLIEELLLMARADGRTPRRPFETTDLRAVVDGEVARLGSDLAGAVTVAVDGGPAPLAADPLMLRHLVRNLLENAQRHGGGKGVRAIVTTTGPAQGDNVVLAVEDAGPGIPVEERERIFAPFYRLPGADRNAGGVGLGLALVRQVARYHGGDARALDGAQGGSRFEVVLPRGGPK